MFSVIPEFTWLLYTGAAVADFDVMQLRKSSSQDQGDLPASLQHIFVCITFHWEVGSLNFLRQVSLSQLSLLSLHDHFQRLHPFM